MPSACRAEIMLSNRFIGILPPLLEGDGYGASHHHQPAEHRGQAYHDLVGPQPTDYRAEYRLHQHGDGHYDWRYPPEYSVYPCVPT